jgi:hypothetical protein
VTLALEIFDGGIIEKEVTVTSVQLEPYDGFTLRMVAEILICLKVLGQLVDEMREMWESGLVWHFQSMWNWIDLLRIGFFGTAIATYALILTDDTATNLTLPLPPNQQFVDFSRLIYLNQLYVRDCGVTILLCLMSVLKYMRHSQTYGTLAITLTYAGPEIMRFLLMFSLVNLTFVVMGLLLFGNSLAEFSTVGSASQTLIMLMTGEFGYEGLQSVNETSALMFYSFCKSRHDSPNQLHV